MNVRLTGDTRDAESMPMFGSRAGRAQTGREAASVFRKDPFRRDPRKSRGTCVVEGRDDDKGKGRS